MEVRYFLDVVHPLGYNYIIYYEDDEIEKLIDNIYLLDFLDIKCNLFLNVSPKRDSRKE